MATTCIALAAGAALIVLPTPTATLIWTHTVEQTGWEEDYAASPEGIIIVEARIEAVGAGMEPPSFAVREGRWWRYRPPLPVLNSVKLANSTFAGGYSLCWDSECRLLSSLVPHGKQVSIIAATCAAAPPAPAAPSP